MCFSQGWVRVLLNVIVMESVLLIGVVVFLGKIGCNTKCHPKSTKCENKNDRIEPNEELSDLSSDSEE
jgi:hypothetical protein